MVTERIKALKERQWNREHHAFRVRFRKVLKTHTERRNYLMFKERPCA